MKKNFILAVLCLIISAMTFAQVPQKMSYQAVVRGSDNNLVTNSEISVRISILQGSTDGEAVYTETHSAMTNANGLVTIEIGDGTSSDDFSAINWANGPYFVKTETDVNGGDNYDIIGVGQLLSVPYAMYAHTAGNVPDISGFLTDEIDPTVPEWAKAENKPAYDYSEIDNTPEIPTVPTAVSAFENDANYLTSYAETDPNVPSWAKAETKPAYDYSEINNTPEIPTVPTNVSAFENDANYWTSYTETQNISDVAALGNSVYTQLKNLTDPTENQDATTKAYVDGLVAQLYTAIDELTRIPDFYTITFDANGGCGIMSEQNIAPGAMRPLLNVAFFKDGFLFAGWNTSSDGTGASFSNGQNIAIWKNMTLYAQWETSSGIMVDSRDGKCYSTVTIGDQTWMAENLRYEGNIPLSSTTSSSNAYRYYPNGQEFNLSTYGYLYNETARMNGESGSSSNPSDVQGICPNGWHLPSDAEWNQLIETLDNSDVAPKLAGNITLWIKGEGTLVNSPVFGTSGFNALPAGTAVPTSGNNPNVKYSSMGQYALFGSATSGRYVYMFNDGSGLTISDCPNQSGISVRCLRNN
jgi:uncharacterized protein (TIGR02145 family)/uncharacterized repeat protein (TIGR02543 family)